MVVQSLYADIETNVVVGVMLTAQKKEKRHRRLANVIVA